MKKGYLLFSLVFALACGVPAQTKQSNSKPSTGRKTAAILAEMSDLAGDETTCGDPRRPSEPYVGTIVKRRFSDDEITLVGVTVRESDDERYFINIDTEHVASKGRFIPRDLSSLLAPNRKVKIWVAACGSAGLTLFVNRVQAFK